MGKKRRYDAEDGAQSSPKKARHAPPKAFVKLPHSPGGTLSGPVQAEQDVATPGKKMRRRKSKGQRREAQSQSNGGGNVATGIAPTVVAESGAVDGGDAVHNATGTETPTGAKTKSPSKNKKSPRYAKSAPEPVHLISAAQALQKQAKRERKKARKAESKSQTVAVLDKAQTTPSKSVQAETDTVVADAAPEKPTSGWSLSSPAAGRFMDQDPIFVRDPVTLEELLITANHREVQVLSIDTSLPISSLPTEEGMVVTCLAVGPMRDSLYIAYSDGRVMEWDWSSGEFSAAPAPDTETVAIQQTTTAVDAKDTFYLTHEAGNSTIYRCLSPLHVSTQKLQSLQVLGDAEYIVAQGPTALVLGMKKGKRADSSFVFVELPVQEGITCVDARLADADGKNAKHPSGLSLVVGNVEGHLRLYDDISSIFAQKGQASLPSPRILHWHREAVSAVKFSKDGNYLISGGKETVLVLWQLETGKKQYLPHLTSEIERIVVSPEGDKYAVQMGDNSIMVLSTSELKPVANFAGLQLALPVPVSLPARGEMVTVSQEKTVAAALHPNDANQLLLAVPATQPKSHSDAAEARPFLQTFDLRTSRHLIRQALARNNVTDFSIGPDKTPVAPPDVAHIVVSRDGQWLATVDEWMPPASDLQHLVRDEGMQIEQERRLRREVYLKIWRWDDGQGLWTLSTRVDAPHSRAVKGVQGAGKVFTLVADPASTGFATVGEDSCVNIWKPKTRVRHGVVMKGQDAVDVVEWTCRRTVELPRQVERADSPVGYSETSVAPSSACLAYSEDGSMLAAAQVLTGAVDIQPLVHFIDTLTGEIKASKAGLAPSQVNALGFLDRYLIAVANRTVSVWDLVTDSFRHRHRLPHNDLAVPMLALSHTDNTFAVAVGTKVSVYGPTDTQALCKIDCGDDIAAILSGKGRRGYTLVFEDATVRTLSTTGAAAAALPAMDETADEETAYAAAEAGAVEVEEAASDVEMAEVLALPSSKAEQGLLLPDAEDDRPVVRPEELAKLFDVGPSFAMPPVKDMFEAVVGLYGRKPHTGSMGGRVAA